MIIKSLLDTDLYKLTMMQAVFHHPGKMLPAKYKFKCRSGEDLRSCKNDIIKELKNFKSLTFSKDETIYLKKNYPFFQDDFIQYLNKFSLQDCEFKVFIKNEQLEIEVYGPWVQAILFEVPLLSIVQETYWKKYFIKNKINKKEFFLEGKKLLHKKTKFVNENGFKFMEFGSRRRFSREWHETVFKIFNEKINPNFFLGTSNISLAKKYKQKALGTMAHEFFQAFQALTPLELSQQEALKYWIKEYHPNLNVALTDIFGMDSFLIDLEKSGVKDKYKGFRHDSGDPFKWGEEILDFFKKNKMNSKEKILVFSDGLKFDETTVGLHNKFSSETQVSFGIGTNCTNDFNKLYNHKALSIVMKLDTLNNKPTIKISDEPAKVTCSNPDLIEKTFKMIKIKTNKELKS